MCIRGVGMFHRTGEPQKRHNHRNPENVWDVMLAVMEHYTKHLFAYVGDQLDQRPRPTCFVLFYRRASLWYRNSCCWFSQIQWFSSVLKKLIKTAQSRSVVDLAERAEPTTDLNTPVMTTSESRWTTSSTRRRNFRSNAIVLATLWRHPITGCKPQLCQPFHSNLIIIYISLPIATQIQFSPVYIPIEHCRHDTQLSRLSICCGELLHVKDQTPLCV